jgi:hypothetical protein
MNKSDPTVLSLTEPTAAPEAMPDPFDLNSLFAVAALRTSGMHPPIAHSRSVVHFPCRPSWAGRPESARRSGRRRCQNSRHPRPGTILSL